MTKLILGLLILAFVGVVLVGLLTLDEIMEQEEIRKDRDV